MMEAGHILLTYEALKQQYTAEFKALKKKEDLISILRLFAFLGFAIGLFLLIKTWSVWMALGIGIMLIAFLFLVRLYDNIGKQKAVKAALIAVNKNELAYLQEKSLCNLLQK